MEQIQSVLDGFALLWRPGKQVSILLTHQTSVYTHSMSHCFKNVLKFQID